MVLRQVRYQLLTFARTPVAVFFTILLPLIMLVLFNALFGNGDVDTGSGTWKFSQFYVGGIAAFTAVSATFTNLANIVPIRRDEGVLKRWRGTPLPPWLYLAGMIGMSFVVAAAGVVVMLALGMAVYGVEIEPAKVPAMVVTFFVGVASFAALGMAVAGLCQTASSAAAVANVIILPMAFISDVFMRPRGPAAVAGHDRRRAAAEAVRPELPGHVQPGRRPAGVLAGPAGAGRRVGCRRRRRCAALVQVGAFPQRSDAATSPGRDRQLEGV